MKKFFIPAIITTFLFILFLGCSGTTTTETTISETTEGETPVISEDSGGSLGEVFSEEEISGDSGESSGEFFSEEPANTVTMGERNALDKAKSYLSFTSFSEKGLKEQLEFEGFTSEEAEYAVANCGADWNEQAAKKAQSYLNLTSFSRKGLIEQLEFEGFTREQAEYGVKAVGY